ncbi:MAG: branched-chain amino acid ABC transporter permease [Chloroflexota bacterium]|nr:branched-chain amino acid ABC transporter permease [Chloroflexota bacterium]
MAIGFGLVTASILAVASVGLTLQFGITNYINFAYGDFMTLGAYIAWQFNTALNANIWLAMVAASIAMGIVAVLFNRLLLAPFTRRFPDLFSILIVTFALSLILLNVIQAIWGPTFRQYQIPQENPMTLGPFLLTGTQLIIIGISAGLMLAVQLLLTRTKLGKAMRAMSDNASLAEVTGIDTARITTITWFLTGILAGLAGTILGVNISSITPSTGETFLFVIFAAVILGGIGKPSGAMLGALIIGLATEVSAIFINSAYKLDVAFALLIVVLLLRPQGLIAAIGKA